MPVHHYAPKAEQDAAAPIRWEPFAKTEQRRLAVAGIGLALLVLGFIVWGINLSSYDPSATGLLFGQLLSVLGSILLFPALLVHLLARRDA